MEERTVLLITGIVCISAVTGIWIQAGHNSLTLAAFTAAIAGLCGYVLPSPYQKKE